MTGEKPVHSMVCRSAIVPTKEAHIVSTQPVRWAKVWFTNISCFSLLFLSNLHFIYCYLLFLLSLSGGQKFCKQVKAMSLLY